MAHSICSPFIPTAFHLIPIVLSRNMFYSLRIEDIFVLVPLNPIVDYKSGLFSKPLVRFGSFWSLQQPCISPAAAPQQSCYSRATIVVELQ